MKLSTRARYGLRMMITLARLNEAGNVHLKDLSREENVSEKYLSQIILPLKSAGMVRSTRGAKGGYQLHRNADEITIREIIEVLEGDLNVVECTADNGSCDELSSCVTKDLWERLSATIADFLEGITLAEMVVKAKNKQIRFTYNI